MADTPQDAETAAREVLSPAQQFARRIIQEICWEGLDADGGSLQDLAVELGLLRTNSSGGYDFTDALRPASSPGEVTEADRERLLCSAIARGFTERGRFGVHMFETEAENEAYKTGLADAGSFIAEDIEAGLPPALLSTTQTEAGNGR